VYPIIYMQLLHIYLIYYFYAIVDLPTPFPLFALRYHMFMIHLSPVENFEYVYIMLQCCILLRVYNVHPLHFIIYS